MKVPYFDLPTHLRAMRPELDAALGRCLDSGAFCLGPEVQQFESEFAAFCEAGHCVAMNSGTSALHVAMRLLDLGPGDEVITTPFTFIATSWAIVYTGARPVFVDVEESTLNLDPNQVEEAITPRTKAVLPVHLYGHPCNLAPLLELARRRNVPVIEDAAQAHGARYHGKLVGTFGLMSAFSFYPTKNLGACGEGGALVTDRADLAARARSLREHGSSARYLHDETGYNYRMEGIQGAVLRAKLPRLGAWNQARRRIAHRYHSLLADTPLVLPREVGPVESVYHLYTVRHPNRDRLKVHLEARNIGSAIHYPHPLHLQKCFAHLGYRPGAFPRSERAACECLSLPMYPELSDDQVDCVAAAIHDFREW
jgi:dTDP-4-amino-4,6-dideoxygalactose transaminase